MCTLTKMTAFRLFLSFLLVIASLVDQGATYPQENELDAYQPAMQSNNDADSDGYRIVKLIDQIYDEVPESLPPPTEAPAPRSKFLLFFDQIGHEFRKFGLGIQSVFTGVPVQSEQEEMNRAGPVAPARLKSLFSGMDEEMTGIQAQLERIQWRIVVEHVRTRFFISEMAIRSGLERVRDYLEHQGKSGDEIRKQRLLTKTADIDAHVLTVLDGLLGRTVFGGDILQATRDLVKCDQLEESANKFMSLIQIGSAVYGVHAKVAGLDPLTKKIFEERFTERYNLAKLRIKNEVVKCQQEDRLKEDMIAIVSGNPDQDGRVARDLVYELLIRKYGPEKAWLVAVFDSREDRDYIDEGGYILRNVTGKDIVIYELSHESPPFPGNLGQQITEFYKMNKPDTIDHRGLVKAVPELANFKLIIIKRGLKVKARWSKSLKPFFQSFDTAVIIAV